MYSFERKFYNIPKTVKDENIPKYVEIEQTIDKLNENQELTNKKLEYYRTKLKELE